MLKRLLFVCLFFLGLVLSSGCVTTKCSASGNVHIKSSSCGATEQIHVKNNPGNSSVMIKVKEKNH